MCARVRQKARRLRGQPADAWRSSLYKELALEEGQLRYVTYGSDGDRWPGDIILELPPAE